MKMSKLLLAGMVISQAVAMQALAAKTKSEIEALCKGNKFEEICKKAMLEQQGGTYASEGAVTKPSKPDVVKPPVVKPTEPTKPTTPVVDDQAPIISSGSYTGPARTAGIKTEADNQALFSKYCIGDATSPAVPQPNYANAEVRKAAAIMSKVANLNIYFYGDVKRIYKAGSPLPADQQAQGTTENAHLYLVQTCGEFRDRAEMVQAKIRWVNNMVLLGDKAQGPIDPSAKNVWAQVSGHSYMPYLEISRAVYDARKSVAMADTYLSSNLHPDAQKAAAGTTVCETKYVLSEYVAKGRGFDSLASFEQGYKSFEGRCGVDAQGRDDREYYYDFRGDSNFKHYSPESNAMLWQAIAIARFCESPTKSNGKSETITDQVCAQYFSKPFLSRYNAARSGMGAWLLYTQSEKAGFQNQGLNVTVLPSFDMKNLGTKPFSMKLSDGSVAKSSLSLQDSTLGFNKMFGIGSSKANLPEAFERLRNAVNRHTNWYASSFDDQLGHEKSVRDQAYSPFVASSYEMSASNGFTECGVTVQCDGDGRKAWMLVFKVKKDNWYNTDSLMQNKPVDFDKMWFDETTFGTDGLADSERAWDRLGTALETELDTILYLHNLESGSGRPVANDQLP